MVNQEELAKRLGSVLDGVELHDAAKALISCLSFAICKGLPDRDARLSYATGVASEIAGAILRYDAYEKKQREH